jgi:translation initiation factor 2B subunit (eIF-2B alpha/beta/delta family)
MLRANERLAGVTELNLIPDASVATFFARANEAAFGVQSAGKMFLPSVDAVLFGTNGVYLEPEPCIAHTSGHLGVAIIAKELGIPLVVVASALKIADQPDHDWQLSHRGKRAEWLTCDSEFLDRLEGVGIWNLREDHVPMRYVTCIVSDVSPNGYYFCDAEEGPEKETVATVRVLKRWRASVRRKMKDVGT